MESFKTKKLHLDFDFTIKQLYKLLNLPPNARITKRLAIYKIMTNF